VSETVRVVLTPGPAPALRELGDLGCKLGIVERHGRRIATTTLTYSLPLPWWKWKGARGKVRRHLPFLSRSVGEEGGLGG
jgi:hypothetical protein